MSPKRDSEPHVAMPEPFVAVVVVPPIVTVVLNTHVTVIPKVVVSFPSIPTTRAVLPGSSALS